MTDRLTIAMNLIAAERGRMGHINREVIRQAFADADDVLNVERVYAAAEKPAEKPPAPAIMPVRFNEFGVARGDGWTADYDHSDASRTVRVYIDLRPGEDAGVLLAKILAAGGRGP